MLIEEKDFKQEAEFHENAQPRGELQKGQTIDLESYANDDEEFGGYENRKKIERRLLLKTDARFLVMVISEFLVFSKGICVENFHLVYILNYIDRNNVPAARDQGLEDDLGIDKSSNQYQTILSILYVGYILMQIPSNGIISLIKRPSLYIGASMACWGTISCLTGITHNFVGCLLTRFFLGFVEAAFLPGALFLLSKWYKKDELGLRMTILYAGNLISNAFGNLIAAGIVGGMEGKLGIRAWRWLFYIEGAMTIFVALCSIFVLPDFPETERFLTPLERKLAIRRMAEDAGKVDQVEGKAEVLQGMKMALLDYRVWWLALALTGMVVSLSFNVYFPTLTKGMGFGEIQSLLLCAPPWIFATLVSFPYSLNSDRRRERTFHIIFSNIIAIVGYVIAIATENQAARYVSLFFMTCGYCGFIVLYAFTANCFIRPTSRRSVAIAFVNAFSQLGNVAGSYVWQSSWDPDYRNSYAICISTTGFSIILLIGFRFILMDLNKKIEKLEEDYPDSSPWDLPETHGLKLDNALLVQRGFRYML